MTTNTHTNQAKEAAMLTSYRDYEIRREMVWDDMIRMHRIAVAVYQDDELMATASTVECACDIIDEVEDED